MGNTKSTEMVSTYEELEMKLQGSDATPILLPLEFLMSITRNFGSVVLGEGGFGVVYKGYLNCGKIIAVKKLNNPHLVNQMFWNEVCHLSEMRKHPNVVQFVGYCDELMPEVMIIDKKPIAAYRREKLLCFEYVPNKSLDKYISDGLYDLGWNTRYKIIKGICKGLHFLHEECRMVHLDLKPQNILMDFAMRPKIADFGLSRIFGVEQSRIITKNCQGTLGYMAKEYIDKGVVTKKADIFSLGVIVTEIITGSREYPNFQGSPVDIATSLQEYKEKVLGSWRYRIFVRSQLGSVENSMQQVEQCITIALKCVDPYMEKRPSIEDIIQMFNALDQVNARSTEILDIHPLKLCFPVVPNKLIPCSLHLTNNTDKQVVFRLTEIEKTNNSDCILNLPLYTIIPARSTYTLTLTLGTSENMPYQREVYLILESIISDEYITPYKYVDVFNQHFSISKWKDLVNRVELKAIYVPQAKMPYEAIQPITQIISIEKTHIAAMYSLDVNQTEPWIITGHQDGHIDIWNHDTRKLMGLVKVENSYKHIIAGSSGVFLPAAVSTIKFIERKQWFIAGTTDGFIYVYNYKGQVQKITRFRAEAYGYTITSLAVHPTQPYVLSSGSEGIKLWDWDKNWECIRTFEEQLDCMNQLTFNPKDTTRFASASDLHIVKLWSLDPLKPEYTLHGHSGRVNCLDYFTRYDQQYLITCSEDMTAKIWDMRTKACICTLDGFMTSVISVISHPEIPILITCTRDGTIYLWSSTNFRKKRIIDVFGGGGTHCLACLTGSRRVLVGSYSALSIMEIHDEESDAR